LLNKKGFTLIEVLVVVLIIGILAALAAPNILGRIEQSRITSDKAMAKTFENAIASYLVDKDAANEPSSPPAGDQFEAVIVNASYLDAATVDWINKQKAATPTAVFADATTFKVNGKAITTTIIYIYDASTASFTVKVSEEPGERVGAGGGS
jgi:prepilin-type N-terminal cleavage/methylation domain-containing protein